MLTAEWIAIFPPVFVCHVLYGC